VHIDHDRAITANSELQRHILQVLSAGHAVELLAVEQHVIRRAVRAAA
jgi:hypothetical protein